MTSRRNHHLEQRGQRWYYVRRVPARFKCIDKRRIVRTSTRPDRVDPWTLSMLERKPVRLATVAMANKTARIIWAVLTKNEPYKPQHTA